MNKLSHAKTNLKKRKNVVAIGGGTGLYQVLVGLKHYPLNISAVVTMADSGGSTGRLRKEFGMLPPGDVRRALLALSNLPFSQKTLEKRFSFRFQRGNELKGHSFGNLLLAALTEITGREDLAIKEAGKIRDVSGYVFPVTMDQTNLVADLENGKLVFGETNIDERWHGKNDSQTPIRRVFLSPEAKISSDAEKAILKADTIIIGPGDLYTSLIPNLVVSGVPEAIANSKADVFVIVNLMTKPGETDGFTALRFVEEIRNYLGPAQNKISHIFLNDKTNYKAPPKILSWYKKFKSEPIKDDLGEQSQGAMVIRGNFTDSGSFLRHDPKKLAYSVFATIKISRAKKPG